MQLLAELSEVTEGEFVFRKLRRVGPIQMISSQPSAEFAICSRAETFIRVVWVTPVLGTRLGDGSHAPSLGGFRVDVTRVPFGSNATHEPTG